MKRAPATTLGRLSWELLPWAAAVAGVVFTGQILLVAAIGTDVPFMEQWELEGRLLYPKWLDGSLAWSDLFAPHNGHRILWTRLSALGLFAVNGQWDPLLQQVFNALLKAIAYGVLTGWLVSRLPDRRARLWLSVAIVIAGLSPSGWHNATWGFQSQVYFAAGFSFLALWTLFHDAGMTRRAIGICAAVAASLAMGAGTFAAIAIVAVVSLRTYAIGSWDQARTWRRLWPAGLALLVVVFIQPAGENVALAPANTAEFLAAWARCLAWPHSGSPGAAIILNAPVLVLFALRIMRWRRSRLVSCSEDGPIAACAGLWLWGFLTATGIAWARGGSPELSAGIPSRYTDFLVVLPIANLLGVWVLINESPDGVAALARPRMRFAAVAWILFLAVGWIGLSTEAWQRVISPRSRDREAPVRMLQQFVAAEGDAEAFLGQPRLLVPHPTPAVVWEIVTDPRLKDRLPPSLQPDEPMGRLSCWTRRLLGHHDASTVPTAKGRP